MQEVPRSFFSFCSLNMNEHLYHRTVMLQKLHKHFDIFFFFFLETMYFQFRSHLKEIVLTNLPSNDFCIHCSHVLLKTAFSE